MLIGMLFGAILALPALRLDGFYYALLTLGLNELCRVYFVTSKEFGSATGGLYGASTYISSQLAAIDAGKCLLLRSICFADRIALLVSFRRWQTSRQNFENGPGETRSIRRSNWRELQKSTRDRIPHFLGGAWVSSGVSTLPNTAA